MSKISKKARHAARRLAVQGVYQWQFSHNSASEIETQLLLDPPIKKMDKEYFSNLFRGVTADITTIDALLTPASARPLSDLTLIELAVLRIAVYELKHRLDIPYRVVIDEALELTKTFGAQDGYKYVNAVLDRLAKELRPLG
jgi:N utilization substance protein B